MTLHDVLMLRAMPVGDDSASFVNAYEEIQLSQPYLARLCATVPENQREAAIQHARHETETLLRLIRAGHQFNDAEQEDWAKKILSAQVDPNARLASINELSNGVKNIINLSPSLLAEYLLQADSAGTILAALLDTAEHVTIDWPSDNQVPSRSTLNTLASRIIEKGIPAFLEQVLSHPRIDINATLKNNQTFVTLLFPSFEKYPSQEIKNRNKNKIEALDVALAHGALLDHLYYKWRNGGSTLSDYFELPAFREYFAAAEQDWQQLQDGKVHPHQLSSLQLGRLYSIGKLQEAMQPQRWTGHEEQALALYDSLPNFVQKECPCEHERTIFYARLAPRSLLHSDNLTHMPPSRQQTQK